MATKNATITGKLTAEMVARTALRLLDDLGLDGLTMRQVAKQLDVQVAALYWHVKNKQQLLNVMATIMITEAFDGLEAPRRGITWDAWVADLAQRLRRSMLHYRDGARVLAGTTITDPLLLRTTELTLRTLHDAGFAIDDAARSFPTLLHYAIGYTIEEQARIEAGPPEPIDTSRYPLTTEAAGELSAPDTDANFEHGLRLILAGMRTTHLPT